jgi:hypothetical protein
MTHRMFCDNCNRDLTGDDYVELHVRPNMLKHALKQSHIIDQTRDYCIDCARAQLGIRIEEK